jgi:hypothetical protein
VDFDAAGQLQIVYSAFGQKKQKYNEAVHQLFINFKKAMSQEGCLV